MTSAGACCKIIVLESGCLVAVTSGLRSGEGKQRCFAGEIEAATSRGKGLEV